MRPILEKKKKNYYLMIFYIAIFVICIIGIAVAVYLDFYKDENMGVIMGIVDEDSEEKDKYNDLKAEFSSIFANKLEKLQNEEIVVNKISDKYDLIATAYTYEKANEKCKLAAYIPCINIRREKTININQKIIEHFKNKAENLKNFDSDENTVYSVSYIAYLQNNILSLVIRSELKEKSKNQKIEIMTFNYDIKQDKEITLEELLKMKDMQKEIAEEKIREEIKEIQAENESLEQILEGKEELYKRDYNSERYKIENTSEFFLGKNNMLYIIYAYGNYENTSEMDVVIIE